MGYSNDDRMVRVDFFRQSGKWHTSSEMLWDRYLTREDNRIELMYDTFRRCLNQAFPHHYREMIAVCLKPYHEHAHPLMLLKR